MPNSQMLWIIVYSQLEHPRIFTICCALFVFAMRPPTLRSAVQSKACEPAAAPPAAVAASKGSVAAVLKPACSASVSTSSGNAELLSDAQRWTRIMKQKTVGRHVTVALFRGSNRSHRLLNRHKVNARKLEATVEQYKQGILEHGVIEEMRGTIVLVPAASGARDEFDIIGGGTLIDAIYKAIAEHEDNPNCQDLLRNGLENNLILSSTCDEGVLTWVKNVHNRFHGGQDSTLAECYREVPNSQKAWAAHKIAEGITVSSCPKTGPFRYNDLDACRS